jgi:hypothetical protein
MFTNPAAPQTRTDCREISHGKKSGTVLFQSN